MQYLSIMLLSNMACLILDQDTLDFNQMFECCNFTIQMKIVRLFKNKFLVATVFFVVWMLFFDHNNIFLHMQYRNELSDLRKGKEYYKEQISKTRQEVELLKKDPRWMEKVAREQYLMKRDNEDVFVVKEDW